MRRLLVLAAVVLAGCPPSKESRKLPAAPVDCDTVVREPVFPDGMVEDLGTLQVGAQKTFTIPDGTQSFVVFSQEASNSAPATVLVGSTRIPNAVVPSELRSPSNEVFYDDFASWPTDAIGSTTYFDVTGILVFDAGFQSVSGGLPFPNTSGALSRLRSGGQVPSGTWSVTVNDWSHACPFGSGCTDGNTSSRYRVHVVKVPGAALPATGTLDLEVYLATDATSALPTAALAASSAAVARWKQSVAFYLAKAGIALGEVHFNDLTADVKQRYAPAGDVDVSSSGPCSDLGQLFTHAVTQKRAVHVFLADTLSAPSQGAFRIAGVDGSIPGPSGFPGTVYGGAIVGLEDWAAEVTSGACSGAGDPSLQTCGTDRVAFVTAHEIGHWLGLFHTTEQDGALFDPVADTDRCACQSCAPQSQRAACEDPVAGKSGTTVVTNGVCVASATCGGGRNLMFWLLDDQFSTGELSADQGQIARLNPAVR